MCIRDSLRNDLQIEMLSFNGRRGDGTFGIAAVLEYQHGRCLLYTSDAADERSSVDLGGRRIIKKKNIEKYHRSIMALQTH